MEGQQAEGPHKANIILFQFKYTLSSKLVLTTAPGFYQDKKGQTNCQICANNYYSNSTGSINCRSCPVNSITADKGTTTSVDCLCGAGYYNKQAQGGYPCDSCPDNANCAGGTDWPRPLYGWCVIDLKIVAAYLP
jgi:hypothetical protein